MSRTENIGDSVGVAETMPDRQHFGLDAERWTQFQEALDSPPRQLPALARLLSEPSPFETSAHPPRCR